MPGQKQGSAVADFQVLGSQGHAFGLHLLHFLPKVLTVQGDAVAEDIDDAVPEDTGGEQMEGELSLFVDDGMPRVAAALIPDHYVIVLRHKVDHTAFSLVAPVDAYDGAIRHNEKPHDQEKFPRKR